jgi:hypothetical protein
MKTKIERAAAYRAKMAGIQHRLFGRLDCDPVPGTVFDPLAFLTDPGRLRDLLSWFRFRAARDGIGSGLSGRLKASALDEAAQNGLSRFLDRDYAADGITADESARAVFSAGAWMKRALWRYGEGRDGKRQWTPYNRAQAAGTPNPAAIVAATFNAAEDRAAILGTGTDETLRLGSVPVAGGSCRPLGDGKIVPTETVVREWVENGTDEDGNPERREMAEIVTGWRMDRRYGFKQDYPQCAVEMAADGVETRRFNRQPLPILSVGELNRTTAKPAPDDGWQEVSPGHYVRLRG